MQKPGKKLTAHLFLHLIQILKRNTQSLHCRSLSASTKPVDVQCRYMGEMTESTCFVPNFATTS